jgi:hypothetical protein
VKLKQENVTLELGIQSRNELVLEMAAEMGLDRIGEDDSEDNKEDEVDDDDDGRDAAAPPAAAAPEFVVKEEEDLEILIQE